MNQKTSELDAAEEALRFLESFASVVISSVSTQGAPEASYAPFVRLDDNAFYLYISQLARHTGNLSATGRASLLLVEDEAGAGEVFARRRLTFACSASIVTRGSSRWTEILDVFDRKFGEVMKMIRPLEDFVLFRLDPESGRYVRGFAQAYRFEGSELDRFRHITDVGHRRAADS